MTELQVTTVISIVSILASLLALVLGLLYFLRLRRDLVVLWRIVISMKKEIRFSSAGLGGQLYFAVK